MIVQTKIHGNTKLRTCPICSIKFYHGWGYYCSYKCFEKSPSYFRENTCRKCGIKFKTEHFLFPWYCKTCDAIATSERIAKVKQKSKARQNGINILRMLALNDAINNMQTTEEICNSPMTTTTALKQTAPT